MKIGDFATYLPRGVISSFLKGIKFDIDEIGKEEIIKNGLYHITSSEEIADKIIQSEYLRPSGIMTSYGKPSVFLFNGKPSVEQFMKNLTNTNLDANPYLNPTMVYSAVKISPTEKEELAKYKSRGLVDDVIVYEGYCILPKDKVEKVKLVPDLVRDENGNPVINKETNKYDIKFREAYKDELSEDGKTYSAREDYLEFVEEQAKELGYKTGKALFKNTKNVINTVVHEGKIEGNMTSSRVKTIPQRISEMFKKLRTPKLDVSTDERIKNEIEEFKNKKKNPYSDPKFGMAIAKFQSEGLKQLNFKEELEAVTTSNVGEYFRDKFNQIDKSHIIEEGGHGINHSNRVAVLSTIIAQKEGFLDNDLDSKKLDMILSAAFYHDIGRKRGPFVNNIGPHAKNSSRKLKDIDLRYSDGTMYSKEDRDILMAVVEAHEGNDKKMDKMCKKYNIPLEKQEYVKQLMTVLKDADALDRVRLDVNLGFKIKTNLNPDYLRTNTSKQLLNASYQLEALSKKVPIDRIIRYKTDKQIELPKTSREKFIDDLKVEIGKTPQKLNEVKKSLILCKEYINTKFRGKGILSKIAKINNQKQVDKNINKNKEQDIEQEL